MIAGWFQLHPHDQDASELKLSGLMSPDIPSKQIAANQSTQEPDDHHLTIIYSYLYLICFSIVDCYNQYHLAISSINKYSTSTTSNNISVGAL